MKWRLVGRAVFNIDLRRWLMVCDYYHVMFVIVRLLCVSDAHWQTCHPCGRLVTHVIVNCRPVAIRGEGAWEAAPCLGSRAFNGPGILSAQWTSLCSMQCTRSGDHRCFISAKFNDKLIDETFKNVRKYFLSVQIWDFVTSLICVFLHAQVNSAVWWSCDRLKKLF